MVANFFEGEFDNDLAKEIINSFDFHIQWLQVNSNGSNGSLRRTVGPPAPNLLRIMSCESEMKKPSSICWV
jgi:hypothetical protein